MGGSTMLLAPILTSMAWFHDGAATVTLPAPVEVPVLLDEGDPRPRVGVQVDGRRIDALLAMPGAVSTLGRISAVRLGVEERGRGTRAVLPEVSIGALVLRDVRVSLVAGEGLTLGLGGLPELAVALDPSTGTARFVRDGDGAELVVALGGMGEGALPVDVSDAADAATVLTHHLVYRPSTGDWAMATADAVRYLDPRAGRRAALEVRAEGWERPEASADPEATSSLSGDPGVGWRAGRFDELARARFVDGDLDGAADAAVAAAGWAGDRCTEWLTLGEVLLRGGTVDGPEAVRGVPLTPVAVLDHTRRLLRAWTEQPPATRGAGFRVRQPEACERVHGLLAAAHLQAGDHEALARLEHPDALEVRAAAALRRQAPGEAAVLLRRSLAADPSADPRRDALLALAEARRGRALPAEAAVCGVAGVGLVEATWLWEVAMRTGSATACNEPSPPRAVVGWLTTGVPPTVPPDRMWALAPGDAAVEASAWLVASVAGVAPPVPPRPSADLAMARVLLAQARSDADAVVTGVEGLRRGWPEVDVGVGKADEIPRVP